MAANFPISKLTLDDLVDIAQTSVDPSSAGYVANIGSVVLRTTGELWIKVGAPDTDWEMIHSGTIIGVTQIASTGIFDGGVLSINGGDNTTFDVTAGVGIIVDNYTDTQNPTAQVVTWGATAAVTVTNLATSTRSFIAIDSGGLIVQMGEPGWTNVEHKDNIVLGNLGHANFTNLVGLRNNPDPAIDATARLADLARALGSFNVSGNVFGPNGNNLQVNKSAGNTYRLGNNFATDKRDADTNTDASGTIIPFIYSHLDGVGGHDLLTPPITAIDPDNYDDGSGTLATVPGGRWQIQVIKYFSGIQGAATSRIEYGQQTFSTKAAALDVLPDANHIHNPAFTEGVIRCYLLVSAGATDLSDLGQAEFIEGAKFGGSGGGQGSGSVTTLQQAYDNSNTPEIVTDGTRGAVTITEGAAVGGNLIEGIDDGATTVFAVAVDGNLTSTSVANLNDMALSTIVGDPSPAQDQIMLTTPDLVRVKSLTLETQTYHFSEAVISPLEWIEVGTASDALSGIIMPFNGTIVRAVGQCIDPGGSLKDIDLWTNAVNTATVGTFSGIVESTFINNTLNIDVAAGDKIRLRGGNQAGNIADSIITIYIKWRA